MQVARRRARACPVEVSTMPVLLALLLAAAAPQKPWTDAPASSPRPTAPPASIAQLAKLAMPAVVGIVAVTARGGSADPFHDFLERMYGSGTAEHEQPVRGIGTGFFVRSDGLLATNGHVVEGATDITVQVGDDERAYRGVLVGKDDATDLALVKVEGGPFPVLALGDSEALEVGEWVVAIGNPFGLSRSVTTGIVSFKGRREVNPSGKPGYYDFIQTDAAINPGNSGGPLLDARGAVVGINAAVNPSGQGIGFAIPIGMLKDLLPQLEKGRVVRSWMGLTVQEQMGPELAESFGVPGGKGAVVTEVVSAGPAARAGLRPGDVITSFDGEPIAESYRLRWLTGNAGPRRTVRVGVWREARHGTGRLARAPGQRCASPGRAVRVRCGGVGQGRPGRPRRGGRPSRRRLPRGASRGGCRSRSRRPSRFRSRRVPPGARRQPIERRAPLRPPRQPGHLLRAAPLPSSRPARRCGAVEGAGQRREPLASPSIPKRRRRGNLPQARLLCVNFPADTRRLHTRSPDSACIGTEHPAAALTRCAGPRRVRSGVTGLSDSGERGVTGKGTLRAAANER
jgi:serine protease Do